MKTTFCDQFKILANIVEVYQKILLSCFFACLQRNANFLSSDHECLDHNPPQQTAHIIK